MKVLVRAFGSHLMGMGHLYRVNKIINALGGCNVTLLTRSYRESKSIYKDIETNNTIEILPEITEYDELKLLECFEESGFDLVINDQLSTSKSMANAICQICKISVTFDDLGHGAHLFNHAINVLYPSLVPMNNERRGYSYLVLEDNSNIKSEIKLPCKVEKIFINQGAADTWGAIPDLIQDLNKLPQKFSMKILLGPSFKHWDELIHSLKETTKKIEIFNKVDSVPELVKDCDIAILGAGNTLFEVAALGIPVVASTRESKELITIKQLLKDKIIYGRNELYTKELSQVVSEVINQESSRREKFERNRRIFNYQGIENIITMINKEVVK
jgi:spore coat polysaccharide biosynthesis predicted glycosyltransferase SpsG